MPLTDEEKIEESGSSPAPSMENQLDVTISKGRGLTEEDITKMKIQYAHDLIDIIKRQDFQVYAVKLGRLMALDADFKANKLRTVITISTEPLE